MEAFDTHLPAIHRKIRIGEHFPRRLARAAPRLDPQERAAPELNGVGELRGEFPVFGAPAAFRVGGNQQAIAMKDQILQQEKEAEQQSTQSRIEKLKEKMPGKPVFKKSP